MTLQTNLFDTKIPACRNSDSMSSYLAADDIQDSGFVAKERTRVYLALKDNPCSTSNELAVAMGGGRHDFDSAHKRLPELASAKINKASKIYDDNLKPVLRPCRVTGKRVCQWIAL